MTHQGSGMQSKSAATHDTDRVTIVLQAREGEILSDIAPYLRLGSTVMVGRGGAVVAALNAGVTIEHAKRLENQIVLAESAMRRGTLMHDQDHLPALRRVIDHVPELYLQVADIIRKEALEDGANQDEADEMAGNAIRALVLLKQKLEKMLDPV